MKTKCNMDQDIVGKKFSQKIYTEKAIFLWPRIAKSRRDATVRQ